MVKPKGRPSPRSRATPVFVYGADGTPLEVVTIATKPRDGLSAIYALRCPRQGKTVYVGKTVNPFQRLRQHCTDFAYHKTPCAKWVMSLKASGLRPQMVILMWTDDWERDEKVVIAAFRDAGVDLLNLADGGNHTAKMPNARRVGMTPFKRVAVRIGAVATKSEAAGRVEMAAKLRAVIKKMKQNRRFLSRWAGPSMAALYDQEVHEKFVRSGILRRNPRYDNYTADHAAT